MVAPKLGKSGVNTTGSSSVVDAKQASGVVFECYEMELLASDRGLATQPSDVLEFREREPRQFEIPKMPQYREYRDSHT